MKIKSAIFIFVLISLFAFSFKVTALVILPGGPTVPLEPTDPESTQAPVIPPKSIPVPTLINPSEPNIGAPEPSSAPRARPIPVGKAKPEDIKQLNNYDIFGNNPNTVDYGRTFIILCCLCLLCVMLIIALGLGFVLYKKRAKRKQ